MKKVFKITLMFFHCVGLVLISALCFSRVCFYATWLRKDDLILWILIIGVLLGHYSFLFLGYKKKAISFKFLYVLKLVEVIYSVTQLAVVVLLYFITWFRLSFGAIYPILVTPVVVLLLRRLGTVLCVDKLVNN